MVFASWMMIAGLVLGASPAVKWVGQDGHDYVSLFPGENPSEVQDIHLALSGLPPDRAITQVLVAALGGNEWQVNGSKNLFPAVLKRAPKSETADLYIEPVRVETGRLFSVRLTFDDGRTIELPLRGKTASPQTRMPEVSLAAKWSGQERQDWTGAGPSVGPDGLQDARIALTRLSAKNELKSALLEGPGGARWEFGLNPKAHHNAEVVRNVKDPSRADLFFHPDRDLNGQKLKLSIGYGDGKTDSTVVTAGKTDPKLTMPVPALPKVLVHAIKGEWLGQDGAAGGGRGNVHVVLTGLPANGPLNAAVMSDSLRGRWVYKANEGIPLESDLEPIPLAFLRRSGSDRGRADLFFAPYRDESDAIMTLRLVYPSGEIAIAQFAGGACDPSLRAPGVAPSSVVAKPGDDLHDLVNRFGTVKLSKGTYVLTRPLSLNQPVTLSGEPGVTLRFSQAASEPPWPAAIAVHRSRTTLDGFAVRFAGPIRWKEDTPWGPALIGATEIHDNSHPDPRIALTFTKLDIETPPAANPAVWVEAPRMMRLVNAGSGRIVGNTFRGGGIEVFDGPWEFTDNDYRGTVPGTWTPGIFAGHSVHDFVARGNRAKPVGPSGKTWRFLVLTGLGSNNRVEKNTIEGIGARDDDTIPWSNMPEIVLTESYKVEFEGKPAAVSADGRIVRIGAPQGEGVNTGDIVAIVAGAHPGEWRKVAQTLNPTTLILEAPLPAKTEAIAIAKGFVNLRVEENLIDARGGSKSASLVLIGNMFGLRVRDNRLLGGGEGFQFTSTATQAPRFWGWTHSPYFGAVIEGNTIEDANQGGIVHVEHSQFTKPSKGRTYLVATFRNNTFRWTEPFLAQRARQGAKDLPAAWLIGSPPPSDPAELILYEQGNALQAPASARANAAVKVAAAILNGRPTVNQTLPLPTGIPFPASPARPKSALSGGAQPPARVP